MKERSPVIGSGTHRPVKTVDEISYCEERLILRRYDSSQVLEEHLGSEGIGYSWQRDLDMHKSNTRKRARGEADQSNVLVW